MENLTFDKLVEAYTWAKTIMGDAPQAILLTPLLNGVDGFWRAEYEGKHYLLVGRIPWARMASELEPMLRHRPFDGDGWTPVMIWGMPVREDDELVRKIMLKLLAAISTLEHRCDEETTHFRRPIC